jgi:hypothetical protein
MENFGALSFQPPTTAVVVTVVAFLFFVFRKTIPDLSEGYITEEEKAAFKRGNFWSNLLLIITFALFVSAWFLALRIVGALLDHGTPGTRFLIQPEKKLWIMPAVFLAIVSMSRPTKRLMRSKYGDSYHRYIRYINEEARFDVGRAFFWLTIVLIVGSAVWFLGMVRGFARFSDTGIELGDPLKLRKSFYEYARVKSIEYTMTMRALNGKLLSKPHYVIVFDDGESWSTFDGRRDQIPELDGQLAQFVSSKSGRPIIQKP